MTIFLPADFPQSLTPSYYLFNHNETHMALPLDYVSIFNHHESPNVKKIKTGHNVYFEVRGGFQCANRNILQICMHA